LIKENSKKHINIDLDTVLFCEITDYDYSEGEMLLEEIKFTVQGYINNREFMVKRTIEICYH